MIHIVFNIWMKQRFAKCLHIFGNLCTPLKLTVIRHIKDAYIHQPQIWIEFLYLQGLKYITGGSTNFILAWHIRYKSKKVCGFCFSVSKNLRKKCVNCDDTILWQKCILRWHNFVTKVHKSIKSLQNLKRSESKNIFKS